MQTEYLKDLPSQNLSQERVLSLDVMRGIIMILLAGESCALYESIHATTSEGIGNAIVNQFFHHPWHGLHFWDLVQPAFMTMAGAALYLSFHKRMQKGISWQQNGWKLAGRCLKLFICGVALHCVYAGRLVWELWNVLTQLSFTTLIAYLIIRKSAAFQITISVLLLLLTECLYRFVLMPGFDQPFVEHQNFGAWFDLQAMGKINSDGWVAINIIPTAAHTIWGVLAGKLLMQQISYSRKIKILLVWAAILLVLGYGLEFSGITPIIKRISTSSFVLVSGGWVLVMLAVLSWLIDLKKMNKYAWIFVAVGTNAIFIYLFFETVGVQWLNRTVGIFVGGFTNLAGLHVNLQAIASALATLFLEWLLCYWLYRRKIFFKL